MSKVNITGWKYVPDPEDDEPCFLTYDLEGTHVGQPFHIKVSMEIDGRDADYTQISGLDMRWDSDDAAARERCDDLLLAFEETPDLKADMEMRANAVLDA